MSTTGHVSAPLQPTLFTTARRVSMPFQGRTMAARSASRSGAQQAAVTQGSKTARILDLLRTGPRSRQDLAQATGIPVNAICSCVESLVQQGVIIEAVGQQQIVLWPSGRTTTRTVWRIA